MAPQILRDEAALREAEARGVQQGRIETVLRLLTRRCGALDAALTEQVRHLPTPQLDALTEALLDFSSSDDLRTWLQ
jgi:hypothetical protein